MKREHENLMKMIDVTVARFFQQINKFGSVKDIPDTKALNEYLKSTMPSQTAEKSFSCCDIIS